MKRKLAWILILAALVTVSAFTQSAAEIEELLSAEAVTYEEAAWFVLRVAEIPGIDNSAGAFNYAMEQNWLPANAAPGDRARLDDLSLLIMRAFDFNGGLLYTAAKNSHYAYRELVYKGIIQGRADPGMAVSGDLLLFLSGRVLSLTEVD